MKITYPAKLLDALLHLRVVRYFFVGGVAAVVDVSLFFIFARVLGFNYFLVGAGAFTVAAVVNYSLSVRHVFTSGVRFGRGREFFYVYLVSFVGLAFNQVILVVAVEIFTLELMLSKCIAIGVVFFWNYLARKHFVFKANTLAYAGPDPGPDSGPNPGPSAEPKAWPEGEGRETGNG